MKKIRTANIRPCKWSTSNTSLCI